MQQPAPRNRPEIAGPQVNGTGSHTSEDDAGGRAPSGERYPLHPNNPVEAFRFRRPGGFRKIGGTDVLPFLSISVRAFENLHGAGFRFSPNMEDEQ